MLYLGVDGGGTKTSFILINEKGEILAFVKEKSCHYLENGLGQFQTVLKTGIEKICKKAQIKIKDLTYSFFGIPCYGEIEEDIPVLESKVEEVLNGNQNYECGNDVEAGWAGSLACKPGINIVAGTGAIGFGRDPAGKSARASGWGYFMGDEGSAYWLGKKLISIFTKQADGRREKTPLYDIVKEEYDLKKDFDLIDIIYEEMEMKRDEVAGMAPLIDRAAAEGDETALNLFKEAAREHSLTVKALINKLNFPEKEKLLVSYSGGVFKAGDYILKPFSNFLENETREIELYPPVLKPVTGAALFALVLSGKNDKNDDIIEKLKQEEMRRF